MKFKIGDYVKVNKPDHYSHESLGIITKISTTNKYDPFLHHIDIIYVANIMYQYDYVNLVCDFELANEQETIKINKLLTFK
jgi:hypothetical protein